jgi:hypothetical protein
LRSLTWATIWGRHNQLKPSGTYDTGNDGTPDPFVLKDGGPATGIDITLIDRRGN